MEAPALGCVTGCRDDRLRDHEAAEEILAEPVGRVADPSTGVVARAYGQEVERLGQHRADIELGFRNAGHGGEPRDP